MRKQIVAGNWKMNNDLDASKSLVKKVIKKLNEHKAFSYIIPEEYDGLNFNVETQSRVLTKLASVNPGLAVTVMVPNSLGPGELLQHYGTDNQKKQYLPKLSTKPSRTFRLYQSKN